MEGGDDELRRVGRVGRLRGQHARHGRAVGRVQRGVDLVEQVEGRRVAALDGKDERERDQRLLPAAQRRERRGRARARAERNLLPRARAHGFYGAHGFIGCSPKGRKHVCNSKQCTVSDAAAAAPAPNGTCRRMCKAVPAANPMAHGHACNGELVSTQKQPARARRPAPF